MAVSDSPRFTRLPSGELHSSRKPPRTVPSSDGASAYDRPTPLVPYAVRTDSGPCVMEQLELADPVIAFAHDPRTTSLRSLGGELIAAHRATCFSLLLDICSIVRTTRRP